MKTIEKSILQAFIAFCEEKQLTYYMCGGSALGAVRHAGFIPWDDDVDVMMPRNDYELLLKTFHSERYRLYSCWNREDYFYPFAKIVDENTLLIENVNAKSKLGVYIDVFPIENLPSDDKLRKRIYRKRSAFMFDITSKTATNKKRSLLKTCGLMALKIKNCRRSLLDIVRAFDTFAKKVSSESDGTAYMGKIIWGYGLKEVMPSNVYKKPSVLQFENLSVNMPTDYDYYLKSLFGNYMELPPEDKRISHRIEAYLLEEEKS